MGGVSGEGRLGGGAGKEGGPKGRGGPRAGERLRG